MKTKVLLGTCTILVVASVYLLSIGLRKENTQPHVSSSESSKENPKGTPSRVTSLKQKEIDQQTPDTIQTQKSERPQKEDPWQDLKNKTDQIGIVREEVVQIDFLKSEDDKLAIPDQIKIPFFEGSSFKAKKVSEKTISDDLYVWKGKSKNNPKYLDVIAVTNNKTGLMSMNFNRNGSDYTLSSDGKGNYLLREMRQGNPDPHD